MSSPGKVVSVRFGVSSWTLLLSWKSRPSVAPPNGLEQDFLDYLRRDRRRRKRRLPRPPYQTAAGVLAISKNDGNPRRGVPDVAGMVAMDGFFFAGVGGPNQYPFIGTSLVAPLYAGLVGVIVKFLGRDAGFLNPIFYTGEARDSSRSADRRSRWRPAHRPADY